MNCAQNPCPNALEGTASNLFLNLINTLMATQCALNPRASYPDDIGSKLINGSEFDFIIVGAGSAGSAVANRLSENPKWRILVLEAGKYPSASSEVPALFLYMKHTAEDWQYQTVNKYACLGLAKGCIWSRGKVLGGSSTINGCMYVRGNPLAYNNWNDLGNKGWGWDEVLPYFKKSENTTRESYRTSPLHGTSGYLTTSYVKSNSYVKNMYMEGAKQVGMLISDDEPSLGYYEVLATIRDGKRCSASKAYLASAANRNNLFLATEAEVGQVIFDKTTAKGVLVKINSKLINVYAKKEVILSAGTIKSPTILQNSNIGLREDLGRKPLVNLHVGRNLLDHLAIFTLFITLNDTASEADEPDRIFDYFTANKGSLSNIGGSNFVGFINTKNKNAKIANVQIFNTFYPKNSPDIHRELEIIGLDTISTKSILEASTKSILWQVAPAILNPKSVGTLLTKSLFDAPIIKPNYLQDGRDIRTLLEAVKFIKSLIQTKAFQRAGAKLFIMKSPYCLQDASTDSYWRCHIKHYATTAYNPVGTCKMGPKNIATSVVDSTLKVHGLNRIRVIDASIMPTIIPGNTNAPAMMIGEKGSAFIKEDWM
ncbi:PREDICTED: glucose dehydrogenase [FAD, quinone]-like [Nicrophorus vespilloides]|uniref:Glucose dehydrogenase [FAD, quinone]-like n=1 Tax=Nicrophorus vespilloides TaxID=110193 RepID=A0ABM1MMR7_NICVS|nr:PREDICTED: glucose dehydrogenase [FAD, quinone]-like [Nicrophorus vespilloides]